MKIFSRVFGIIVIAFCVLLALANRTPVLFSLDPLPPVSEGLSVETPLYAIIFSAVLIGILIGGLTVWLGQRKKRLWIADTKPPANNLPLETPPRDY